MKYFAYSQKEFVYKYVVMLSDVDQFQHMSFASYLRLMFLATDALLMTDINQEFIHQFRLTLRNSNMQFKRQTIAGDSILIKINASHVMEDNFVLVYTFIAENTGDLIGLGRQVYQMKLLQGNNVVPLTLTMKQLLETIEVDEDQLLYKY